MKLQASDLAHLTKDELISIILQLVSRVEELENKVELLQHRKNSNNSSVPPSKDENRPKRKTTSLRAPSGKKPGGQNGHEGKTLQMATTPDDVIDHKPQYCTCCGKDLSNVDAELIEQRQRVELPPIHPLYIEHRIYSRKCECGNMATGVFPDGVTPGISYGESIESMAAYLSARQFVPFKRMGEMFKNVFNLQISDGALVNVINRITKKAVSAYELIRQKASKSKVNGGDETGTKIGSEKAWFWTIQGRLFTFIIASLNRGTKTLTDNFPKGFMFSIMVHDCWKSYFKISCVAHQICIAHLLRELNYFNECHNLEWAKKMKQLFLEAIQFKKILKPEDYQQKHLSQRTEYENRLSLLLAELVDPKCKDVVTFQTRLIKYRQHIFTFLYHREVPPDNNGSERAIRNLKIKHKISGYFKSLAGAESFAVLRSIIDTAIKNGLNPLSSLRQIAAVNYRGE
jgi:transposase